MDLDPNMHPNEALRQRTPVLCRNVSPLTPLRRFGERLLLGMPSSLSVLDGGPARGSMDKNCNNFVADQTPSE